MLVRFATSRPGGSFDEDFSVTRAWSGTFPATVDEVRHARRVLACFLGDSPLTADAVLCLSELVTNSIEHSNSRCLGGHVSVRAKMVAGRLRVEVEDQGGPWGHPSASVDSHRGRGLRVVGVLSQRWGRTDGGARSRTVWFEMGTSLTSPEPPAEFNNGTVVPPC
jgi:anti-sigma regulatory factor (Ser/Thr protein kinase)